MTFHLPSPPPTQSMRVSLLMPVFSSQWTRTGRMPAVSINYEVPILRAVTHSMGQDHDTSSHLCWFEILWCVIHKPENPEASDQDTSNDSQLHTLTCRNSQFKCTHKNTSNDFQLYTLTSKNKFWAAYFKYLVQVISDATPKSSTSAANRCL